MAGRNARRATWSCQPQRVSGFSWRALDFAMRFLPESVAERSLARPGLEQLRVDLFPEPVSQAREVVAQVPGDVPVVIGEVEKDGIARPRARRRAYARRC